MKNSITNNVKRPALWSFVAGAIVISIVWFTSGIGARIISPSGNYYDTNSMMDGSYSGMSEAPSLMSKESSFVGSDVVGNMTQDRTITRNSLSVHVESVSDFHTEVSNYVSSVSGKIMNEDITVSTGTESESGVLTVLIPNANADDFFSLLEDKSIKVVDRQITSYEISQEYTDIARQLAQYEETYSRVVTYFEQAESVEDLLSIQSSLDQVQRQIDSLKGRQMALSELSDNTQYTIYSSTNEYDLPYIPSGTFEISKTFKLAVRSLVGFSDGVVSMLIYLIVYIPVIAILGLVFLGVKKLATKKS